MRLFGPNIERLASKGDIRGLTRALEHKDPYVRRDAAEALERIGPAPSINTLAYQRDIDGLIKALRFRDESVREAAARALGSLGDTSAVEPLVLALGDQQARVRSSAAEALERLGWQAATASERALSATARGDWSGAVAEGAAAFEALSAALEDEDRQRREEAARALGELGDARAVEPLVTALTTHVQWAPEALRKLGDPRAAGQLADPLSDQDRHVRHLARYALQGLGQPGAEALVAALSDEDPEIRSEVAGALGEMLVDANAAEAMSDNDYARAAETLVAASGDVDDRVRTAATWALGKVLAGQDADRRLGEDGRARAAEALAAAAGDDNQDVRQAAASALATTGDVRAVEPLLAALRAEDKQARKSAAETLGGLGDARALEPLVAALGDEDVLVREAAAVALGELRDTRAVEPLVTAVKDEEARVRRCAANALGQLGNARAVIPLVGLARAKQGDDAVKALELLLTHAAADIALPDLQTLASLSGLVQREEHWDYMTVRPGLESLEKISETDEPVDSARVRELARAELARRGGAESTRALTEVLLSSADPTVRVEAADSVGTMGDASAVDGLTATLKDSDDAVREAAVKALGTLGEARAVALLVTALKDRSEVVRRLAAEALESLRWQPADDAERALYAVAKCDWETAAQIGPAGLEALTFAFDHGSFSSAVSFRLVADAMAQSGNAQALRTLTGRIRGASVWDEFGEATAEALAQSGSQTGVSLLIAVARDRSLGEDIRKGTAQVLAGSGDPRAVEAASELS